MNPTAKRPNDESQRDGIRERRQYHAPAIEESADFETLALTCASTTPAECDFNPEGS